MAMVTASSGAMAIPDINALFGRAEAAFQAGKLAAARADLGAVLRVTGDHPAVLHLLALVEAQAGARPAARAAFVRALRGAPHDPQINNNFANFLDDDGEGEAALKHYDAALAHAPGFDQARLNRAGVLSRLGRLDAALVDLEAILAKAPGTVAALVSRGGVHLRAGRVAAAVADFDAGLKLAPQNPKALLGRARAAMEAGDEAAAVPFYRAALALAPDDLDLVLGLAEALEACGDDAAIPMLAAAVGREPRWIAGQDGLARMRSEAGDSGGLDAGYRAAVAAHPGDRGLVLAHVACLARASRHGDALAALDAARLGRDAETSLYEAVLASESGDLARADAAFARLDRSDNVQLARGRHALRLQDPAAAAAALEPLARANLGAVTAWAHLGLAWRLLGDARHEWLAEQPGLLGVQDLAFDAAEIDALAAVLRGLHRTRAHPIGQSLRGGTQTRGRLFGRPASAIAGLEARLRDALAAHMGGLPPQDPRHPLLRYRDTPLHFEGSWSVRLSGAGFHINHIHPAGVLSSAFYVAVPAAGADQAGWLEIGSPPVELALGLPPLRMVEPKPGRLALFPSTMFHGTRPFANGERLTVAFDVSA